MVPFSVCFFFGVYRVVVKCRFAFHFVLSSVGQRACLHVWPPAAPAAAHPALCGKVPVSAGGVLRSESEQSQQSSSAVCEMIDLFSFRLFEQNERSLSVWCFCCKKMSFVSHVVCFVSRATCWGGNPYFLLFRLAAGWKQDRSCAF